MKYLLSSCFLFLLLLGCTQKEAQRIRQRPQPEPTSQVPSVDKALVPLLRLDMSDGPRLLEQDLRFLAADELKGRDTPSPGLDTAAAYITRTLNSLGYQVKRVPIPLQKVPAVETSKLAFSDLSLGTDELLVVDGTTGGRPLTAPIVYAGYGLDTKGFEKGLAGTIVVTEVGDGEVTDPRQYYQLAKHKRERFAAVGALAVIETYRSKVAPLSRVKPRLEGEQLALVTDAAASNIPLVWVNDPAGKVSKELQTAAGTALDLTIARPATMNVDAVNLVASSPGTTMAAEAGKIVASAHYDHVGIGAPVAGDSIYNGARDNGMGTAALLHLARSLANSPTARTVDLHFVSAEEKGLLGSESLLRGLSPVELASIAFNVNLDGGGYTDTSLVTINGYDRTTAQGTIDAAILTDNIRVLPDPVPEYGLYQASDNWNYAKRGIPSINLAPGFTDFDEELLQYYHQPKDEADAINFRYAYAYAQAAEAAVRVLADSPTRFTWKLDDELHQRAKELQQAADADD